MFSTVSDSRLGRFTLVAVMAIAVAILHLLLFASKPTAIIFDEVAHLAGAKYIFRGGAPGVFDWTLKGYGLILYLLATPFGGVQNFSEGQIHAFARGLNVVLSAAAVPVAYGFLRDFDFRVGRALLGAVAVASMPVFFVWTPYAMTEVVFSTFCIAYLFVLLRYFDGNDGYRYLYLVISLGLAFFITSLKGVGSYYIGTTSVLLLLIYRFEKSAWLFVLLSAIVVFLTHQTSLMFGYGIMDLYANRAPLYLLVFLFGCIMSLALSLLHVAPLFRLFPVRPIWDQRADLTQRAQNALLISVVGFLLPSIAISSLFHAFLGTLTAYRTVTSVLPLLLVAAIAVFGAAPASEQGNAARFKLRAWHLRMGLIAVFFGALFALKAFSGVYRLDNQPDFFTWLPLFNYLAAPIGGMATWVMIALLVAFVLLAAVTSISLRLIGTILINAALLYSFMLWSWQADQTRNGVYLANLKMYRSVQALNPDSIILIDNPVDVQWLHFAYPYVWNDGAKTTVAFLNAGGKESVVGHGIGVVRQPVINAEFLHKEDAGGQAFFSYDLNAPRLRDVARIAIADLVARGNAVNLNSAGGLGHETYALAQSRTVFGPFILPAGRTMRITLWAAPVAPEAQYQGCVLASNTARWPLEIVSAPTAQANEWTLAANITPEATLFGMLRLDCQVSAIHPTGNSVTLPLSGLSLAQSR